ncbi:MAG: hypothetical protein AAB625_00330 [Patescibacteria group bacterium]
MSEIPLSVEPQKNSRSFTEIQEDLYSFKNSPNPEKERELRIERARLINEAKEVGIFVSMKHHLLDIQTNNPSITTSAPLINSINVQRLEDEAKGLSGWDDKFDGLLQAYKEGALRNMSLAFLKKTNGSVLEVADIEKEIDLLNWGTPPALVNSMPIQPELATQNGGMDPHEFARAMAEAQGLQTPEKYLQDALDTEEYLKTAFQIVPGAEPRFWPILTEEQKAEWQVRATLLIAAYKKNNADGTDKLYMGERKEMAVDLGKLAQQRIFKKPGVLATVGVYGTVIGDKKFRDWQKLEDVEYEEDVKNKDGSIRHKKGDIKHKGLYNADGTPSDINLKKVFCEVLKNDDIKKSLINDYGKDLLHKLLASEIKLQEGCADSFYPHKDKIQGTPIDEKSFRETRKSVRHWLLTKGRDLLLSEDELANRDEFFDTRFSSKEDLFKEMSLRAREAEQIAWNYIYITDLIENFDSREYRPEGTGRLFPSSFWQLFQWVPMHPQERFEAKIRRDLDPKEHWSSLGTWGVYQITHGGLRDEKGNFKVPDSLKVLPDTLIRSPLLPQRFKKGKGEEESLFTIFNGIGNNVLSGDISTISNTELFNRINWEKMDDGPFVPYVYDEMRWADVVTNVFKKGGKRESKVSGEDLSEAVYNLGLNRRQRELLLLSYLNRVGIDPMASTLKPAVNLIAFKGAMDGFLHDNPNYFYGV